MDTFLIETVKKIVSEVTKPSGWADMALVGNNMNKAGINFKSFGFLKLKEFFSDSEVEPFFEVKADDSRPPVYSIRLKMGKASSKMKIKKDETPNLIRWAYMGDFQSAIARLKLLALEERWYYEKNDPTFPNPILSNYLKYTFVRLFKQKKICYSDKYAAFNTGLVDTLYEPIFALFQKNRNEGRQEWFFLDFCVAGQEQEGKTLVSYFNPLPERATYPKSVSDYIYDGSTPIIDWRHIILENIERLPIDFLVENRPENFVIRKTEGMEEAEKRAYYNDFARAIETDDKTYRAMQNRINDALKVSIKRAVWNYKTAIPMYYPQRDTFSLLLPLALVKEGEIDVALVVEKMPSGLYQGQTILPLEWAYSDARLVTRPDSDWLVAKNIE